MPCKLTVKTLLVSIVGFITTSLYAQQLDKRHTHHTYEFGVANSFVYFAKEKENAYGLHMHLVKNSNHSALGFGIAYERIFDEHKHNTIGLVGSYYLFESLHINLTPGVTFKDNEPLNMKFAFHAGTSYNFSLGNFHLGPMLELAFDPEDYHISIGLHMGYGF